MALTEANVVEDALKITAVLNKHLAEDPNCTHSLKEIAEEIFR